MNCNGEPFTHICEWKRRSPSSGSSGSICWIFVVATVALGSASMICFPLSVLLSGSDSESEPASVLEAFSSATSDCLARHSLVLWVELLWNSPFSRILLRLCGVVLYLRLWWVASPCLAPLFCGLGVPFPCFGFADPKSRFFCLNFCSIFTEYRARKCLGNPSRLAYTGVNNRGTWAPNVTQCPWYPASCEGYGKYYLGPFPAIAWSTLYIYLHLSQRGNTVP